MSARELDQLNDKLGESLECIESYPLLGDPSFFDPARGTDCIRADQSAVFTRVYAHSSTVPRVLQEWGSTIGEYRRFVRGPNWIVMGPPDALTTVTSRPDASAIRAKAPTDVGISAKDARLDGCMSILTSTAADKVLAPDRFADSLNGADQEIPGARRVIETTVTPSVAASLRAERDFVVSSNLTRFSDAYRDLCRDQAAPSVG